MAMPKFVFLFPENFEDNLYSLEKENKHLLSLLLLY